MDMDITWKVWRLEGSRMYFYKEGCTQHEAMMHGMELLSNGHGVAIKPVNEAAKRKADAFQKEMDALNNEFEEATGRRMF